VQEQPNQHQPDDQRVVIVTPPVQGKRWALRTEGHFSEPESHGCSLSANKVGYRGVCSQDNPREKAEPQEHRYEHGPVAPRISLSAI